MCFFLIVGGFLAFIIGVSLTACAYLFFPIIYRNTKGKVSEKKAKKYALWNSIIWCGIFNLLLPMATGDQGPVNFLPALYYYDFAKLILVDHNPLVNNYSGKKVEECEEGDKCVDHNNINNDEKSVIENGDIENDIMIKEEPLDIESLNEQDTQQNVEIQQGDASNSSYNIIDTKKQRHKWAYFDDYQISYIIVDKFVVKHLSLTVQDVYSMLRLTQDYGKNSIIDKIKNTKTLLEENNIPNTLNCGKLKNYSKQHKKAFDDVCNNLGVKVK